MKTALQELIKQIDERIEKSKKFIDDQDEVGVVMTTMLIAGFMESKFFAQNLLEMEKEQMVETWENGKRSTQCKTPICQMKTGIGYYNKTFKQQEQ
jgi:hypothetical protein